MENEDQLKYPTGKFKEPETLDMEILKTEISSIAGLPVKLNKLLANTSIKTLQNNRYRKAGWTAFQVINHISDSHMNAFIKCKIILTEDNPTTKSYIADKWAELADNLQDNVAPILILIEGLHAKWAAILNALDESQLNRTFYNSKKDINIPLYKNIGLYAWHGEHHLKHIERAINQPA